MYELIIVGAGPIGLFAAFYAGMRNLKTLVLEAKSIYGGQPKFLYPQKNIYDLPGIKEISGQNLVETLYQQYQTFEKDIPILYNSIIEHIIQINEGYLIKVNDHEYITKTVLICSGNGNFKPIKLDIEGVDKCKNIQYKLEELNLYHNKKIVILGGGDSAVDYANMVVNNSLATTLIHRRNEFRAHEESISLFKNNEKAIIATNKKIIGINKIDDNGISILVEDNESNEKSEIPFDYCIVSYGMMPSENPFSKILEIDSLGIKVNSKQESSKPGIYVAGNAASYLGKSRTLACGFGEVIICITNIHQYLFPDKNPLFYSSTNYKKEN